MFLHHERWLPVVTEPVKQAAETAGKTAPRKLCGIDPFFMSLPCYYFSAMTHLADMPEKSLRSKQDVI